MAAKRAALKLDAVKATKGGTAAAPAAQADTPKPTAGKDRTGQTLRLHAPAWRQLKILAMDKTAARNDGSRTTSHDLLIEAVNDLFRKNGLPEIA